MSSVRKVVLGLYGLSRLTAATSGNSPCTQGSYTPYEYVGCFQDSGESRALSYMPPMDFGSVTVESCTAQCKADGYHYAGLEYYGRVIPYHCALYF